MAENVKLRQEMERKIARKVMEEGRKAGYTFTVNNGEDEEPEKPTPDIDEVLGIMFATDDEYLIFYRGEVRVGWVWFIYGNGNGGLDVISDYTINLGAVMKPVDDFISQYN